MKVLVLGAAGGVGREAVAQAAAAGHEVTAFVRNPDAYTPPPGARVAVGDAHDEASVRAALAGQDAVLVCLNTHAGLAKSDELTRMAEVISAAMRAEGVRRIVVCASAGVDGELTGAVGKLVAFTLRNPLADHHGALEHYRAAGFDLTVARPMGLSDDALRTDYRTDPTAAPKGGRTIPRASVAHFMVHALSDPTTVGASVGLAL